MNPGFRPIDNKILVQPSAAPEFSDGVYGAKIALPDTMSKEKKKASQGEVLAVGPGRRRPDSHERVPMDVKIGDVVQFSTYAGIETQVHGERFLVLVEDEVLGIVEG